jgi:hypothetical protein
MGRPIEITHLVLLSRKSPNHAEDYAWRDAIAIW